MNKEKFKSNILHQINSHMPAIMMLLIKDNRDNPGQAIEYESNCYYYHKYYELVIQFNLLGFVDGHPSYQVLFFDMPSLDEEWSKQIKGELSNIDELLAVVRETMDFEDDMIIFGNTIERFQEVGYGLYSMLPIEKNKIAVYHLDSGNLVYHQTDYDSLERKKIYKPFKICVDLKLSMEEYTTLKLKIEEWAFRNNLYPKHRDDIEEFCRFCRDTLGNKTFSSMAKIIRSLNSLRLPNAVKAQRIVDDFNSKNYGDLLRTAKGHQ